MSNLINKYDFLQIVFWNNQIADWLVALGIFFVAWIVLVFFKIFIIARLKKIAQKTKTEIDNMAIDSFDSVNAKFFILISVYIGMQFLVLSDRVMLCAHYVFLTVVVYYAIKFVCRLIDFGASTIIKKRKEAQEAFGIISFMSGLLKVALWLGALVLLLSNIGYNVTSLIAGLGIGGIAVALALQNILGDLFSSLAIFLDKPFKVGDFIVMGEYTGVVKKIGIKTTRLQALQGEEIVVPNNELTNSKVQNFGVMKKRRAIFTIGVTYDTSKEKLEKIPGMIKSIIEKIEKTEVDRIHFKSFGDSSLLFEIVFYVHSGVYSDYMDIQQSINLDIVDALEREKIEIAFPTRTVYFKK